MFGVVSFWVILNLDSEAITVSWPILYIIINPGHFPGQFLLKFLKINLCMYLCDLYIELGAQTHGPKIKNKMLYWMSKPGTPFQGNF